MAEGGGRTLDCFTNSEASSTGPLKGLGHEMTIFLKFLIINRYFLGQQTSLK
jgi:hypothetical protein